MGCGHSKIGSMKKSKSIRKKDKNKDSNIQTDNENVNKPDDVNEIKTEPELDVDIAEKSEIKNISLKAQTTQNSSSPLLTQSELSESQQEFFKMLDEKIENGPDYNENDSLIEQSRLNLILKDWNTQKKTLQNRNSNKITLHTSTSNINRHKKIDQKQVEISKEVICESFDVIPSQYHYQTTNNQRNFSTIPNHYINYTMERNLYPQTSSLNRSNHVTNLSNYQTSPNHSPKHYQHHPHQLYNLQHIQHLQQQQTLKQTLSPKHHPTSPYHLANNGYQQQQFHQPQSQQPQRNRDQRVVMLQQHIRHNQPSVVTPLVAVIKNTNFDLNSVQRKFES